MGREGAASPSTCPLSALSEAGTGYLLSIEHHEIEDDEGNKHGQDRQSDLESVLAPLRHDVLEFSRLPILCRSALLRRQKTRERLTPLAGRGCQTPCGAGYRQFIVQI